MSSTVAIPMEASLYSNSPRHRSKANPEISKSFKQARDLFLQRRLSEAFSTIKHLVTEGKPEETLEATSTVGEEGSKKSAPIAYASRSSRVKVWSLYITLLNAIVELGPDEGKKEFGSKDWSSLLTKLQDGSIWAEVINVGYGGEEGQVDSDVVVNLANLLLARSPTQIITQQHLESYLSTSGQPNLERFATQINLKQHASSSPSHHSGTDTPRDLESRIQIIELYTLHVLPRNGEWEYAKEFINMSEVLDEERREAFVQTLNDLEHEEKGTTPLQNLEPMQEPEKVQDTPVMDSISSDSTSTVKESRPSSRGPDYGIHVPKSPQKSEASNTKATPPPKPIRKPSNSIYPSRSSRPMGNSAQRRPTQTSLFKRSTAILATLQHVVSNLGQQLSQNPMAILRFVLFLMGLIAAFSRRDVKDRLAAGWDKVKRTVGMGVKVSYI